MDKINPDTYCGIYCGACSILVHGERGSADAFAQCLGSVPKGDISCHGCKSDKVYAGCRVCGFRDCAVARGVEHCVECAEYPCKMYNSWQAAAFFLPHVGEAAPSLETIRSEGVSAWLAAQKKRWSCAVCGEPFSWYQFECRSCGRSLAPESFGLAGWKKLLCRFILPKVYRKGKKMNGSRA